MTYFLKYLKNNADKLTFICIILIICCFSCKKNSSEIQYSNANIDTCISIPPLEGASIGYDIIEDTVIYRSPCFNPNDCNEFLYVATINGVKGLFTYNMVFREKRLLYSGEIYSCPSWGKNNWILFTLSDYNIWKIKSNGDSLTKITSSGGYFNPTWSPDAKYFMYNNPDCQNKITIVDIDNNVYKILPTTDLPSWGENNILIYNDSHGVYFYNINNDSTFFKWFEYGFNGGGFLWINTNIAIYTGSFLFNLETTNAIIKINMLGDTCLIKPYCSGWSYGERTYCNSTNKIIFVKDTYSLINEFTLFRKSSLVIMNPNGSYEFKIQIL